MSRYVILSPCCPQPVLDLLEEQGCHIIVTKQQKNMPLAEQYHADLQAFAPDEHTLVAAPGVWEEYRWELEPVGIRVLRGRTDSNGHYPATAAYNIARVGDTAFGLGAGVDPVVLEELEKRRISFCPVRQGYAACSVAAVSDRAVITSDRGITAAAKRAGMECLLVSPEGILLPGCEHGLIGGCFGNIRPGLLIAAGDVSLYPWGKEALALFARHGARLIQHRGHELFDFGGMLSLEGK